MVLKIVMFSGIHLHMLVNQSFHEKISILRNTTSTLPKLLHTSNQKKKKKITAHGNQA